ncbi:MAG: beta-ketoacyl-ACP synthase III [Pseudomonadota bacterium]
MSTHIRAVITGTGSYLPAAPVTNDDLAKIVDTSDEWIAQRSGIRTRHFAKDETTAQMAIHAAQKAMAAADLRGEDIGAIIVATTTPDTTFPATAAHVQHAVGAPGCIAFDVQAVCSGFVYALALADNFIRLGQAKHVLVIGAERMSNLLDWSDRTTCVLFGDGAGAVVLSAHRGTGDMTDRGVLASCLHADGKHRDILYTTGGPGTNGESGKIVMQGKDVFKQAVTLMAEVVTEILSQSGVSAQAIDWLVPHQANLRIIEATATKLGLPMDKVVVTVDRHGNTSAASIPLALDVAYRDGRIKPGQLVLLEALGGGLTWGAALLRA